MTKCRSVIIVVTSSSRPRRVEFTCGGTSCACEFFCARRRQQQPRNVNRGRRCRRRAKTAARERRAGRRRFLRPGGGERSRLRRPRASAAVRCFHFGVRVFPPLARILPVTDDTAGGSGHHTRCDFRNPCCNGSPRAVIFARAEISHVGSFVLYYVSICLPVNVPNRKSYESARRART